MSAGISSFVIGTSAIGGAVPLGYEKIESMEEATPLTVPEGATAALIAAELAPLRYRDDGVPPTRTEGMPMQPGEKLFYSGGLESLLFIEQVGGAKLSALYYGSAPSEDEEEVS